MSTELQADSTADDGDASGAPDIFAAVDLGSNSFHLLVAENNAGHLSVVDRLREPVQLAAGLTSAGRLTNEARERALESLRRLGQRLEHFHASRVRAVGTNTLRKAKDAAEFLEEAEAALGHPIEIIAGREEARLIYLGAAHSAPTEPGQRLVLDIGGGSTELIIGSGLDILRRYSLYMGCVSMSREFFSDGLLDRKRFRRARLAAELELEPVLKKLRKTGWQHVIGCSGTIRAARSLALEWGLATDELTADAVRGLVRRLIAAGDIGSVTASSLSESRRSVLPGGLAILAGLFKHLRIESLRISSGALREGLLYDMLGRLGDEDARERSVRTLENQFPVDMTQSERVAETCASMLAMVAGDWDLKREVAGKLLNWSARLHEIGLRIAHAKYHRHGAYLIQNADLPGFSQQEQRVVAELVAAHRRKLPADFGSQLPNRSRQQAPRMLALLRLAVLFHRARSDEVVPDLRVNADGDLLRLTLPAQWLEEHPLSAADLEREVTWISAAGIQLQIKSEAA